MIILVVYVDDIIVTSSNTKEIDDTKLQLQKHFVIKDICKLHYFLGIEISRSNQGVSLCQRYAMDLLEETELLRAKSATTHMQTRLDL